VSQKNCSSSSGWTLVIPPIPIVLWLSLHLLCVSNLNCLPFILSEPNPSQFYSIIYESSGFIGIETECFVSYYGHSWVNDTFKPKWQIGQGFRKTLTGSWFQHFLSNRAPDEQSCCFPNPCFRITKNWLNQIELLIYILSIKNNISDLWLCEARKFHSPNRMKLVQSPLMGNKVVKPNITFQNAGHSTENQTLIIPNRFHSYFFSPKDIVSYRRKTALGSKLIR